MSCQMLDGKETACPSGQAGFVVPPCLAGRQARNDVIARTRNGEEDTPFAWQAVSKRNYIYDMTLTVLHMN